MRAVCSEICMTGLKVENMAAFKQYLIVDQRSGPIRIGANVLYPPDLLGPITDFRCFGAIPPAATAASDAQIIGAPAAF